MRALDKPRSWMVLFRIVGTFAVLSLAAIAVAVLAIDGSEGRAIRTWDDSFGTFESRLERYPLREANRQALELERLSAAVGISLEAPTQHTHELPKIDDGIYQEVRPQISVYVRRQLENSGGTEEPPFDVWQFLVEREEQIAAVRDYLIHEPVPYWPRDIERVLFTPTYNPLGHVSLNTLLLADALAAISKGDPSRALADLEASWKLAQSIRHNLFLNTHTIVLRTLQKHAGVLRRIENPPDVWYERLDPANYRVEALDTLIHFGWLWAHTDDTIRTDPDVGIMRRIAGTAARPYIQLCQINTMAAYHPNLEKLIDLDYRCDRDLEAVGVKLEWPEPWWNKMVQPVEVGVRQYINLWRHVEFDLEATRKWIEVRRAVRANGGDWPEAMPTIETSRVCPNDRWLYTVDESGRPDLRLSRAVSWSDRTGALKMPYFLFD